MKWNGKLIFLATVALVYSPGLSAEAGPQTHVPGNPNQTSGRPVDFPPSTSPSSSAMLYSVYSACGLTPPSGLGGVPSFPPAIHPEATPDQGTEPNHPPTADVTQGQQLYVEKCLVCHGKSVSIQGKETFVPMQPLSASRLAVIGQSAKAHNPPFKDLPADMAQKLKAYLESETSGSVPKNAR